MSPGFCSPGRIGETVDSVGILGGGVHLADNRGRGGDSGSDMTDCGHPAVLVDALELIARYGCETYVGPRDCRDDTGRARGADYGAEAWCSSCVAQDALDQFAGKGVGGTLEESPLSAGSWVGSIPTSDTPAPSPVPDQPQPGEPTMDLNEGRLLPHLPQPGNLQPIPPDVEATLDALVHPPATVPHPFVALRPDNPGDDLTELLAAVNNTGSHPEYHREVMRRHRREWPTLWKAIDRLLGRPRQ